MNISQAGLPQGWEIKKLGEVCDIIYGYTEKAVFGAVGPKFMRITDIQNGEVDWDSVPFCKIEEREIKKYELSDGDILFARTGATTRKSFLVKNPPKSVFASYLIRVRLTKINFLPTYLYQYFQTNSYWAIINKGISGSAQGGFNVTKLSELPIPTPPLPEQQRIVSILDKAFAAIDKAKANAEQNLKNAKELFESYLQRVFEKGNWETKTVNQISENLDNKRIPITKSQRKSGNIPYYGASGIVDYVEDYIFDENLLCISEDGANLLARTYPIAFSISGKTWVNNHAHVLRFPDFTTHKYVEIYINSIRIDDFVSGMAQPKLNQTMLNKIPIPFPPHEQQQSIVRQLDTLRAETQKLETVYQKKLDNLEELKKSILQKAFSGELETGKTIEI